MKTITHVFAFIGAAVWAFLATPAGQAVLHQYPILSAIIGALGTVGLVYHNPLKD